ncbi:CPBP family intramembrane metalloprotease [Frankia sp. AgB1.9]|uniref:CPBP family intramembrane glutamic endopeptidase n=1 Tax=unclassified Frankia TaxID=2632575 RepID=UPI0019334829|nr:MULTISPECIES: type II CAAX endopeptidase family protein [unclassified Frankia]MBL7490950.1 CPBP family intramembrane metalloprotease [Frankia sp. AgW1.1]MBL7550296.1 CPBP family intramembrane metalloprotease [Frankia sp. AgB1.9]MBL7619133.1 CPBP family intramembrane metalloprotease [Frankia sp. AgB1.8]
MIPRSVAARQAALFTGLVFAAEVVLALLFPGRDGPAPLLSILVPTLAVVVITFGFTRRGHRREIWAGVGFNRPGWRLWPAALALPAAVVLIPYLVAWAAGLVRFHELALTLPDLFLEAVVFTVVILGEEIGWRGFLLPRLQSLLPRRRAALATGFLHGLFHVPILTLTASYDTDGSRWVVTPVVVLAITFAGVFYAWLRDASASIWPVAVAHNMVNTALDYLSTTAVTASPVALAYIAGESGLVTLAAIAAVAAWLLVGPYRRKATATTVPRAVEPTGQVLTA